MMTICPVPGCETPAPDRGVFCPDHYFQIPRKFACERESDPERRRHLAEQLQGYIAAAIRIMGWGAGHAA
jgi:hypothetical protein